jgi:hypothetical protein
LLQLFCAATPSPAATQDELSGEQLCKYADPTKMWPAKMRRAPSTDERRVPDLLAFKGNPLFGMYARCCSHIHLSIVATEPTEAPNATLLLLRKASDEFKKNVDEICASVRLHTQA